MTGLQKSFSEWQECYLYDGVFEDAERAKRAYFMFRVIMFPQEACVKITVIATPVRHHHTALHCMTANDACMTANDACMTAE